MAGAREKESRDGAKEREGCLRKQRGQKLQTFGKMEEVALGLGRRCVGGCPVTEEERWMPSPVGSRGIQVKRMPEA